jgi:hypothetical protein
MPDPARAWQLVARLDEMDPPSRARGTGHPYSPIYRRIVAATISARAGQRDRARAELDSAIRATAGDSTLRLDLAIDEAYLLHVLGERSRARALLEQRLAIEPALARRIANDPLILAIRSDSTRAR